MADDPRAAPRAGYPELGQFYIRQTESKQTGDREVLPGVLTMIGKLSVTSQFKVSLHLNAPGSGITNNNSNELMKHLQKAKLLDDKLDVLSYDFYCSEASLPGTVLNAGQEAGSRQGVIETFPTHRIFPPVDITFYVDKEFKIIRIFEEWMNFINPIYDYRSNTAYSPNQRGQGDYKDSQNYFRLRYPSDYRKIISITKFERDFREDKNPKKLKDKINSVTYRLIDAYPDNISAIPVTYQGSEITKANIRFTYSRYIIETSNETKVN